MTSNSNLSFSMCLRRLCCLRKLSRQEQWVARWREKFWISEFSNNR